MTPETRLLHHGMGEILYDDYGRAITPPSVPEGYYSTGLLFSPYVLIDRPMYDVGSGEFPGTGFPGTSTPTTSAPTPSTPTGGGSTSTGTRTTATSTAQGGSGSPASSVTPVKQPDASRPDANVSNSTPGIVMPGSKGTTTAATAAKAAQQPGGFTIPQLPTWAWVGIALLAAHYFSEN